jgi:hypothetical protein
MTKKTEPDHIFKDASTRFTTETAGKTIKDTQIVSRVVSALQLRPPIDATKKLSDIAQGNLNNWDLALTLMAYPPFRRDGLELSKRDVLAAQFLGDLGDLVFTWYSTNGWTIQQ